MVLAVDGTAWIVQDSTYNEETNTYTVKLSGSTIYTVQVEEDGSVTITLNVLEEKAA